MKALVISEWRKIRTTRTAWLLGLATVVIAVITAIATQAGEFPADRPLSNPLLRDMPVFVGLFILVLGLRAVTDEFRHGTITTSILATPSRARIVTAKAIVTGLIGMAFAVIAEIIVVVLTVALSAAKGPVAVEGVLLAQLLAGAAAAGLITAVLGVGVGAVVKHQLGAVVGGLAWFLVAEELLAGILKDAGKWLPAQTARGLTQVARDDLLRPGPAGIAFAIYALTALAAGAIVMRRRDIA